MGLLQGPKAAADTSRRAEAWYAAVGFMASEAVADGDTGRAWTVGELRSRDWDALHQLWWVCVKERNRLATEKIERKRLNAGYGDYENQGRDKTVQETMKAILDTLAERHQAYQEAYALAQRDPDIDLSRTDGPQYTQPPYVSLPLDAI